MSRPAKEQRVKVEKPIGIDFSTPIVSSFSIKGTEHDRPDTRLHDAFCYLNQEYSFEDGMKFLFKYMEKNNYSKEDVERAKNGPKFAFGLTTWQSAKLALDDCTLPIASLIYLEKKISDGLRLCFTPKKESTEEVVVNKRPSVQDHIAAQAAIHNGVIALEVDKLIEKVGTDFSAYNYFVEKEVSAPTAGYVQKYFAGQYSEALQAQMGDDELRQGYSYFADDQLLRYSLFLKQIMDDCDRWMKNKRSARKPRAKKVRKASEQISKLKYQKEFVDLKLVSINPEQILGASSLWVYNTKDRKLAVYHALTHDGFTIKGTTLQNFDERISIQKKVRKPEIIIKRVLDGGKVVLKHLMGEVKAKEQKVTGRINGFTMILRAGK